ncbi:hypothetical protein UYO_2813 [Lachnospiraceae bacterium JC7]|nr:hypothetical protein UYO_2813 [Lachnospiraceae bacterium JC7]
MTLEEALKMIEKLENENKALKKELEYYRNRKVSGRKKHDDKWLQKYRDFEILYESGKTMVEIVEMSDFSRRTAYRFKEYYDRIHGGERE